MRNVYTANDRIDAQLCYDYLTKRGLSVHVQGMDLHSAAGELPPDLPVTVWVVDDHDYAMALRLIEHYQTPPPPDAQDWSCSRCGETIEAQFALCWNCGTPHYTA